MIPSLLLAVAFILLALYLWHLRQRPYAAVPFLLGIGLLTLTITIKVQDENRTLAKQDVDTLLDHLSTTDLWRINEVDRADERLLLASTASQALLRAKTWYPERAGAIDSTLAVLAYFAASPTNFPQWKRQRSWDEQVFFLAHAGATLAHYQLATGNAGRASELGRIGNHLGTRLIRSKYKHLPSRADEPFFRPADNAAALYTLSLYERIDSAGLLLPTYTDWSAYLTDELYYEESRLPCAAFSTTNTCQLEPSAAATGLYIAYRAAAREEVETDIPYREWLHYFKGGISTPFTLSIRQDMRQDEQTRFCGLGSKPLKCGRYESAVALWASAEYDGDYAYFRLFAGRLLGRWLNERPDYAAMSPAKRVEALQGVAFWALGEGL
ncbi:hypothetical protein [Lewinella sp. 4G2]|uniref:hypothetical protein n=1 Tax=Lewinella sp. 4G2 TaxID=1803372 RepID=UPI0007B49082|nr:hypothetical protein [Lewinella sp. 4G2]OAV44767.1 hypothetical protein A3850_009815 [Lewinella sp. 4G2]